MSSHCTSSKSDIPISPLSLRPLNALAYSLSHPAPVPPAWAVVRLRSIGQSQPLVQSSTTVAHHLTSLPHQHQVRWGGILVKLLNKYRKKLSLKIQWRPFYDTLVNTHFTRSLLENPCHNSSFDGAGFVRLFLPTNVDNTDFFSVCLQDVSAGCSFSSLNLCTSMILVCRLKEKIGVRVLVGLG
ncbi:hypothetical protein Vadar_025556 [Vaccinium darrowii]|uniref:Uncharacterized protein n=1 Tax=Vaccinium darrowii TaxID=229202 RepID=A0ACB7XUI9_9ERIC|nr:hypothetical protein Vadar_025556 [Vaccinium darrowii]